jgi:hypothetical protein
MKKRTYQADRVQLTAFGIARPEQGALFGADVGRDDHDDDRGDWRDDYAKLGLEPLTLETD